MNALISIVVFVLSFVSPACTRQAAPPPALSAEGRAAYDLLAAADVFAIGPVGAAGTTSANETALRLLLREPQATAALASLTESATPAGKLYGLAGLSVTDRDGVVTVGHRVEAFDGSTEVDEVLGCTVLRVKVADVIARIERGECADQLERPARPAAGR